MPSQNGASNSLMNLDKRSKIMLIVLAVILVIAATYFLVLKKSSSSGSASPSVATPSTSATAPKASAAPTIKPPATPAPIVAGDNTRDPFQALIQEAAATSSASPAATSSTPSSSAPSSTPSSTGHTVGLLAISGTTASVSYDNGTAKSVKAGSTIATGITVEKVNSDTVLIKYSNSAYALTLGQTVNLTSS